MSHLPPKLALLCRPLPALLLCLLPFCLAGAHAPCTPAVSISNSATLVVCKGDSAVLTATPVNGGASPIYQWKLNGTNTGSNSSSYTRTNPVDGDIIVVVMTSSDTCANPSTASDTLTLRVIEILPNAAPTPATCGQKDGTVQVSVTGNGTPPYTFSIDGGTSQSDSTFTGLQGGIHYLIVRDANGCEGYTAVSVPITGSITSANVSVVNETCGLTNGEIHINSVTGSSAPYLITLVGKSSQTGATPVIFTSLATGEYQVTIKGADSCEFIVNGIFVWTAGSITDVPTTSTPATCANNDGTITVDTAGISGGTAPFQSSLNGGAYQSSVTFTGLPAGTYNITVRDANGCSYTVQETVSPPPPIQVNYTVTNATCENPFGKLTVSAASGGQSPYSYQINTSSFGTSPPSENLQVGYYTIKVTDANNCTTSKTALIVSDCKYVEVEVINMVTPNGDGVNDRLFIKEIDRYPTAEIYIYDRWGQRVYYKKRYVNAEGWDGTYNGGALPEGTYYYILDLHTRNNEGKEARLEGFITLMR